MKEIRIFLASSYELEPDRARIGNLIRELNDELESRYIHLRLVKWEDLDAFYNLQGKQAEYDSRIRNCELFIGLFWHVAGMYTVHEVEIAREHLKAENLFLFRKTAEFKPDHEGSEDEKRFLELHPDAKDDVRELEAFLKEEQYETYPDFGALRAILTEKLRKYCDTVEVTDEDRKRRYSQNALQIHVTASPEAEPDLARLGDLVRYLDENSKHYCRVKLIPNIPDSDMFVSLCHTSAPKPIPDEIDTAINCGSGKDGRPRLYFCLKYVAEDAKEQSLKELEERLQGVFEHYPDRYTQAAEMKLHFLMQLALLKHPSGGVALAVKDGTICQQLGDSKYPLLSCEDMVPLQKDPDYQALKAERARLLDEIAELSEKDRRTEEDLSQQIYRLHQELAEVDQRLDDKRKGYFKLARTLEVYVGKEQDEEIAEVRDLIARGMLEQAVKKLPDSQTQRQSREERKERRLAEDRRAYEVCKLTIDCLGASNLRKNRDEIFSLFELLIDIAAEDLRDAEKEADTCIDYGWYLSNFAFYDRALEYFDRALAIQKKVLSEDHPDTAEIYSYIGNVLSVKGDIGGGLEYYEKALAIQKRQLGEEHPDVATSYNNIGLTLFNKCDCDRALEYCEKALAICEKALGEDHPLTATCCMSLGGIWNAKGDGDRAIVYFERALKISDKLFGENDPFSTPACYAGIGMIKESKGDYDRAIVYYEKALAIQKRVSEDHPTAASCYCSIGNVLKTKGYYDRAIEYYEKALAIQKRVVGENNHIAAVCYDSIGEVWFAKGDYVRALEYYEQTLAILKKTLGEEHPNTAKSYNDVADCHERIGAISYKKGDYDRAIEHYEQALAIREKMLGKEHPDLARLCNGLGVVWCAKGDYDRAIMYYERALAIRKKALGEDHPDTALCFSNIGAAWYDKGDYDRALVYDEKALTIRKKALGEEHPDTAEGYCNVADCHDRIGAISYKKGDYDRAIECCEKALAIRQKVLGEDHPKTANCYNNIGMVWHDKGGFDRALEYYEKALAIRKKVLGEDHPATATSYNNIGGVWHDKGYYDRAIEYYEKALAICEKVLGEEHPNTVRCRDNIAKARKAMTDRDR